MPMNLKKYFFKSFSSSNKFSGPILLGGGLIWLLTVAIIDTVSIKTDGYVTGYETYTDTKSKTWHKVKFEYKDPSGSTIQHTSLGGSGGKFYTLGESVRIAYIKNSQKLRFIYSFKSFYLAPILFSFIGLLFIFLNKMRASKKIA